MANGGRDWVTSRQLGSRIGCCRHTSAHTFRVSVCGDKEEHVYREAFNTTEITWWKMNRFLVPLLNYLPITDERGVLAVKCYQPNVAATLTYPTV